MPNKVEICGINTSRLEVLSAEETDALLRRSVSGDRAARERLISCNLRLVLRVIQRFPDAEKAWMICFRSAASV